MGWLEKSKDISEVKNHCRNSLMGGFCEKIRDSVPSQTDNP